MKYEIQLTRTFANRLSNSLWSGIGCAARLRTLACRTWWFCCCWMAFKLFWWFFVGDVAFLMVVIGVTLPTFVAGTKSSLLLCVGAVACSCDDDKPIFVFFALFSRLLFYEFIRIESKNQFFINITIVRWPVMYIIYANAFLFRILRLCGCTFSLIYWIVLCFFLFRLYLSSLSSPLVFFISVIFYVSLFRSMQCI